MSRNPAAPSPAWALFYPAAALAAAGLILVSFGPGLVAQTGGRAALVNAASGQPVEAVLGPAALAQTSPDAWTVTYVVRAALGAPSAVRLAVKPNAPADAPGAQLALTAETGARLSNRPVRVRVAIKPIVDTKADALSIRLIGKDGAGAWVSQALADQANLDFDLPAVADVSALGFRLTSSRTDFNAGVEVTNVQLLRQAQP